ncbi:MAG: response regulator [Syntrophobacteraceae bacterium]|jgi:DNA-binding NtrC family response regulator|nr:response regulator [Syntrophobacteraceae bacterium]
MSELMRVLLVDDEQMFVESLKKVLRRRGMEVESVDNGSDALKLLEEGSYDVMVLDLRMPGMDGIETLKAIREKDTVVPVIMLTGHIDMKQVSEALKYCVAEILLKPCPVETLVSCIENAFERKCCVLDLEDKF